VCRRSRLLSGGLRSRNSNTADALLCKCFSETLLSLSPARGSRAICDLSKSFSGHSTSDCRSRIDYFCEIPRLVPIYPRIEARRLAFAKCPVSGAGWFVLPSSTRRGKGTTRNRDKQINKLAGQGKASRGERAREREREREPSRTGDSRANVRRRGRRPDTDG